MKSLTRSEINSAQLPNDVRTKHISSADVDHNGREYVGLCVREILIKFAYFSSHFFFRSGRFWILNCSKLNIWFMLACRAKTYCVDSTKCQTHMLIFHIAFAHHFSSFLFVFDFRRSGVPNLWPQKLLHCLKVKPTTMTNVVIYGRLEWLHTFFCAAIRHSRAIANKIVVGIAARIAAIVRSCCLNRFKEVSEN